VWSAGACLARAKLAPRFTPRDEVGVISIVIPVLHEGAALPATLAAVASLARMAAIPFQHRLGRRPSVGRRFFEPVR